MVLTMTGVGGSGGTPEAVARRTAVDSGVSPVGTGRLWLGLLLAPLTWFVAELTGYYLASRSCELGRGGVPFAGTTNPRATHLIVETVALVIVIAGIVIAQQNWRATAGDVQPGDSPARGRAHFMAFAGVMLGVLALFGVLLFDASALVVNACSQAR